MRSSTDEPGFAERPDSPRFLIIPKAARSDREPVLGGLAVRDVSYMNTHGGDAEKGEAWHPVDDRTGEVRDRFVAKARANHHPTVKPLALMRHLVRLVTPQGGTVLDPFLGSGTTALAAEMEGFAWVGIEKEAEYVAIAEARLNGTQRGLGLDTSAPESQRSPSKSHWPARRGPHKAEGWGFSGGQEGLLERTEGDGG